MSTGIQGLFQILEPVFRGVGGLDFVKIDAGPIPLGGFEINPPDAVVGLVAGQRIFRHRYQVVKGGNRRGRISAGQVGFADSEIAGRQESPLWIRIHQGCI